MFFSVSGSLYKTWINRADIILPLNHPGGEQNFSNLIFPNDEARGVPTSREEKVRAFLLLLPQSLRSKRNRDLQVREPNRAMGY